MNWAWFSRLRRDYSTQPIEVAIETLALCNARCTFCPYPTLERIGTKLPDEVLERLIDEMATFQQPFHFSPFKVNEPLLDKRLIPACKAFNDKAPKGFLRLFTNGSALTDSNIAEIAQLKRVTHLWVSLNSHDPKEYEDLMGLKFEQTAKRLDNLHEKDFPHKVVISRVGLGDEFVYYVRERWPKFTPSIITKAAWIDYTDPQDTEIPDMPCIRWWELSITATGKASLCCMDGEAEYGFGDVTTQTLLEIYNHPTLKNWREQQPSRLGVGNPCRGCSY